MSRALPTVLAGFAACALAWVPAPSVLADDPAQEEAMVQHFRDGLDRYERQQFQEAAAELERFLEMDPSSDLVYRLWRESGDEMLRAMMRSDPALQLIVRRLIDRARSHEGERLVDWDHIERLIHQVETDLERSRDSDETTLMFWDAMEKLARIGAPAVPQLVEHLNDYKNDRVRARVMMVIERIGSPATLPLVEALNSPQRLLRQNVSILLGNIGRATGDRRALGHLLRVWEQPDESPEVKEVVGAAIEAIAGAAPGSLPSAKEHLLLLAEQFYYDEDLAAASRILSDPKGGLSLVWVWRADAQHPDGGKLVPLNLIPYESPDGRTQEGFVPTFAYNELLAEETLYDALASDPGYEPAIALLVATYLAQELEVLDLIDTSRNAEGHDAERQYLDRRRGELAKARLFALAAGPRYVHQALRRALRDRDVGLAEACMEILEAVDDGSQVPASERDRARAGEGAYPVFFPDLSGAAHGPEGEGRR